MNMGQDTKDEMRVATPAEIATIVRMFREMRGWTQETLAELGRIQPRTVQRVEAGKRSSRDTHRALARVFELDNMDFFDLPFTLPTSDELAAQRAEFERTHLILDAVEVDGRAVAAMVSEMSDFGAVGSSGISDLPPAVQDDFAFILDFVRDLMDVRDVAGHVEMLSYGDDLQEHVARLAMDDHALFAAKRKAAAKVLPDGTRTFPLDIVYLLAAPKLAGVRKMAVPREVSGTL